MYRSRIIKVKVNELFNKLNYSINLENGEDIAIVIAPNGCGKTTIFNLIDFSIAPTYLKFEKIRNVPFDSIEIVFDSGETVKLAKFKFDDAADYFETQDRQLTTAQMDIVGDLLDILNEGNEIAYNYRLSVFDSKGSKDVEFMNQMVNEYFESRRSGIELKVSEEDKMLTEGLGMEAPSYLESRVRFLFKSMRSLLKENFLDAEVMFIEASRIQPKQSTRDFDPSRRRRQERKEPILEAKKEIDRIVSEKLNEYDEKKDKATESLAFKYVNEYKEVLKKKISFETFVKAWSEYNEDIKKYSDLGLLPSFGKDQIDLVSNEEEARETYNTIGAYLNIFLQENEKNTAPLKEIYSKLKLFKDIFDSRNSVTGKKVFFTRNGLVIQDCSGETPVDIPLTVLSSGEKHDFIMFYELLFNTKKNSLILVDEPEISLHISWQEEYIDYLLDICRNGDLQALVATHSPSIVNGHFDLIVEKYDA